MREPFALGRVGEANGADRALEGDTLQHQGRRCAVDREHVVRVHLVGAEDGADDVDLVAEALGNDGRSGRSISRSVRIAWSVALPSRRKNEPGILPAAYIRSSMSTVRGKKSVPSRTLRAAVAVTRTIVSPIRATTAPSAWQASLPVSNDRVRSVPVSGPTR